MQVTTDLTLVEKGQKYGRITSLVGLLILIGGLIFSFQQISGGIQGGYAVIVVYAALLIGFILSNVGIFLANRWLREPRADQLLEKVLKSFDNRYRLYNYCLPARHVLLTPAGLVVLLMKRQDGEITVEGDRWRRKFTFMRLLRFFVEEGLGNPTEEVRHETGLMRTLLAEEMPETDIPVIPLVVFTAPEAKLELDIQNPSVPVVHVSDLKAQVRELGQERALPTKTYKQLVQILDDTAES
jgi:hypothetical protein